MTILPTSVHFQISEHGWDDYLATYVMPGEEGDAARCDSSHVLVAHTNFLADMNTESLNIILKLNGCGVPSYVRAMPACLKMGSLYESKILQFQVHPLCMYVLSFISQRRKGHEHSAGKFNSKLSLSSSTRNLSVKDLLSRASKPLSTMPTDTQSSEVDILHTDIDGGETGRKRGAEHMSLVHRPFLSVLCGIPCQNMQLLAAIESHDSKRSGSLASPATQARVLV